MEFKLTFSIRPILAKFIHYECRTRHTEQQRQAFFYISGVAGVRKRRWDVAIAMETERERGCFGESEGIELRRKKRGKGLLKRK